MCSAARNPTPSEGAPAARRAMLVLEHLAGCPQGARLTELSQSLHIGPSSALTLLAALREGGYVVRQGDTYRVGAGLAALGCAAAALFDPHDAFRAVAATLVEATGETALLWQVQDKAATIVAAQEGWRDLRFVPRIGWQLNCTQGAAVTHSFAVGVQPELGELEPGLGSWTVSLPGIPGRIGQHLILGLVGPLDRLSGPGIGQALQRAAEHFTSLAGASARSVQHEVMGAEQLTMAADDASSTAQNTLSVSESARRSGEPAPIGGSGALAADELTAFLAEPLIAVLAYQNEDGYPTTVPVWFHWEGTTFWLLPGPGARWAAQLSTNPRVSLTVGEVAPPLRRVNVEGKASVLHEPALAERVRATLARRYASTGARDLAWRGAPGLVVRIEAIRLRSWRGLGTRLATDETTATGAEGTA